MSAEDRTAPYRLLLNRPPTESELEELNNGALRDADLAAVAHHVASSEEHAALASASPCQVNVLAGSAVAAAHLPPGTPSGDGAAAGFDAAVGENGRLFIAHGANDFLSQYQGTYPLADGWEERWLSLLAAQEESAQRAGVKTVGLVVPDKLAVYPDEFPEAIGDGQMRPVLRLLGRGADLLYPADELRAARGSGESYLRTDSHVTLRGAKAIYDSVLSALGLSASLPLDDRDCTNVLMGGDLGAKFNPVPVELASVLTATELDFTFDNSGPVLALGGHIGVRRVIRNENAPRPETVVIFGDSYSYLDPHVQSNLGGLFARDFREVHFVWAPFCWDSGYVERAGAQIVIRQMAERFAIITPSPEVDVEALAAQTIERKSAIGPEELSRSSPTMNICTIVARNYLAHARVLGESFRAHHRGGECIVLVIDDQEGLVDDSDEPFTIVRPEDLAIEHFGEMRSAYDVTELSTAVKPWLLRYMLERHDSGGGVAYLDPDICIYSRMVEVEEALANSSLVLTPHLTAEIPRDDRTPAEVNILIAGTFNLGFIGLASGEQSQALLDWWSERLLRDCINDPEQGLFVDQRWVDLIPGLFPDFVSLRNPGYNVAYWNLPARSLSEAESGYLVDGEPLRFFHFSGFDPGHPGRLSQHQDRIIVREDPVLEKLCAQYAGALNEADVVEAAKYPYGYQLLPSGMKLTGLHRSLYREGRDRGELTADLHTSAGEAEFIGWMNERAEPEQGTRSPQYTRYLECLWEERPDLRRAYPDPGGADAKGFNGWCWVFGRTEIPIDERLLPPKPRGLGEASERRQEPPRGVNVVGYLNAELGVGEAARQLAGSLDSAGVLTELSTIEAPANRQGHVYAAGNSTNNPFPINIICVNADALPDFASAAGAEFFEGRYSIGLWWWEVEQFPERFDPAFDYLDEIWVGSRFVADAISPVSPVPVVVMPVALDFADCEPLQAGEFGWPDAFTFLYSYDYNSVFERKNPLAAIEAYTAAFGPEDGTALVLKSINSERDAANHQRVIDAVGDRSDIIVLAEYLDAGDKNRLAASCDCYLSLHRSEGFGLTLAEAMYFGKPAIATAYGGNLEFMTAENSFLVPCEMTAVGDGNDPYPSDAEWAEPNIAVAASLMREVFDDQEAARERGLVGQQSIRRAHSPSVVGGAMSRRLDRVFTRLGSSPTALAVADSPGAQLAELIDLGHQPVAASRYGKVGGVLRRLVLRAARPITNYQQRVNEQLLDLVAAEAAAAERRSVEQRAQLLAELRRQSEQD